jgi:hypothetical protein
VNSRNIYNHENCFSPFSSRTNAKMFAPARLSSGGPLWEREAPAPAFYI